MQRNTQPARATPAAASIRLVQDYTIRDLTGVDIRPTKEFPVDPANQAGFDNSGESLAMSPALLKKYLQAARTVAEHLALKPHGFDFAPHPVVADTDRDKYSVLRIVLAYLASRLDAMPEGEGSVLDNTCLLYLSNMWSGTRHDNTKLPVLTVGGLGGTLKTGRVLDYTQAGDENRKLCSLHLSLMDRMGVRLPRFGDADTRLADL